MEPLAVRLRPFGEADLWYFDRLANDREFSAPFEWGGFTSAESWRRRWREDGLLGSSPYCLVVAAVADDLLVGLVDWRQNERPGAGVWVIGVLIVPEYRGRGAGT
jgi:RimJ/RimL family protein N-acetyltransferase